MHKARAALLLISCGTTAGFHAPPVRRRAPTTCAASILGELGTHLLALDFSAPDAGISAPGAGTHLLAFDFDSLKDSVLDARDSVLDAKDSVLDAKEAAADSVAQAKASALEQVETTKANAVGAVLKPIKEAKAALPPEVQSVIPEKVDLPKVSLPGSVPDLGELAEPAGPFAGRRRRGLVRVLVEVRHVHLGRECGRRRPAACDGARAACEAAGVAVHAAAHAAMHVWLARLSGEGDTVVGVISHGRGHVPGAFAATVGHFAAAVPVRVPC